MASGSGKALFVWLKLDFVYPEDYISIMNIVRETNLFSMWLRKLRDVKGRARIAARIDAAKLGNFGDCKGLGDGVSEMRIHFGPAYRVYYAQEGQCVYLLLLGGDKSTQEKDIAKAKELWTSIKKSKA